MPLPIREGHGNHGHGEGVSRSLKGHCLETDRPPPWKKSQNYEGDFGRIRAEEKRDPFIYRHLWGIVNTCLNMAEDQTAEDLPKLLGKTRVSKQFWGSKPDKT
jgi:hypothetical protein